MTHVDAIVPRGRRLTLDLCAELARLAPFGLGNPAVTLLAPGCELDALSTVGEGKHLRFRVRRDGTDAGSAIAFGIGARLDSYRRDGPLGRRVPARGEPLERHRVAAARRAPDLRRRRRATTSCATWLVAEFRKPAAARSADAAAVFAELEVGAAGLGRRHLLESERFRALLASEPAFARAA